MPETANVNISISTIWQFALSLVAALGGGAMIVVTVVKFCSEKIADRLQKKYQLKIDKEMELFKSEIDKKYEVHKTSLGTKQHIKYGCNLYNIRC